MNTQNLEEAMKNIAESLGESVEDIKHDIAEAFESQIATLKAKTGRDCGSCSLCCRVLEIEALEKPANKWCDKCKPGKGGCSIYATRPPECRAFACLWLVKPIPDYWRPEVSKIVPHTTVDGTLFFECDSRFPNRWREEPYLSNIRAATIERLNISSDLATYVACGDRRFMVLSSSTQEVFDGEACICLSFGPDRWEMIKMKSPQAAVEFTTVMNGLITALRGARGDALRDFLAE